MINVAFKNIQRNRTRTILSLAGIIIGVSAIIALVSVVDGLYSELDNVIGQVEGIRVLKTRGDPAFSRLDLSLESKLDSFEGVRVAVPFIMGQIGTLEGDELLYGGARLIGVDFAKQAQARSTGLGGEIVQGRNIRSGENGVAVIGKALKENYNKFLGSTISVNDKKLKVVGIFSSGSDLTDSAVVVSLQDARELLSFPQAKVSGFNLELISPDQGPLAVDKLNFQFKDDFVALSASDLSEEFGAILGNFRLLVVAVAAISSIVAGVGIINTMLMSVIERFVEIGVLKAIGWTNSSIMKMILLESTLIGIIGGVFGILFGFFASTMLSYFFGLTVLVSLTLVLQVFLYALSLGVIGGVYPAFVASKMDPVEALRSE